MIYILLYIVGYVVTLFLFSRYGKKYLGIDYDSDKENIHNDWDTNAQAYAAWSIGWPLVYVVLSVIGIWRTLMWLSKTLIKINNK